MNNYEIRAITLHDVSGMAELLMKRQELEAKEFPFLKNSCLQVEHVLDKLQQLLVKSKATGIGAFANGELLIAGGLSYPLTAPLADSNGRWSGSWYVSPSNAYLYILRCGIL